MSESETPYMNVSTQIKKMVQQALDSGDSGDAMRFSQAACNAASAMACVNNDLHCQRQVNKRKSKK